VKEMGVTEAKIQTVEDIYRLVRTAVVSKRPIRAIYHGRERWFCRTNWAGIAKGRLECFAISIAGRAAAGCKLQAPRQTGVVSS